MLAVSGIKTHVGLRNWSIGDERFKQKERSLSLLSDISLHWSILIHAFCLVKDSGWQEDGVPSQLCHCQSMFSQQIQQEAFWCPWCRMSIMGSWCHCSCCPTCAFLSNFFSSWWLSVRHVFCTAFPTMKFKTDICNIRYWGRDCSMFWKVMRPRQNHSQSFFVKGIVLPKIKNAYFPLIYSDIYTSWLFWWDLASLQYNVTTWNFTCGFQSAKKIHFKKPRSNFSL